MGGAGGRLEGQEGDWRGRREIGRGAQGGG